MNYVRDLPHEYLELCPIIDEKYKVVFKLGFGRFSQYIPSNSGSRWASTSPPTNASPSKS